MLTEEKIAKGGMDMEHTFKSSLFGGFNRSDVTRYIEKTALEARDRIDALEKENDGLCRENSDLRTEVDFVTAARDRLSDSYADLIKRHRSAEESLADAQTQLAAALEKIAALEGERAKLQSTVAQLQKTADEYESMKAHISDIELQARQRAGELEERTHRQLSELLDSCRRRCEEITSVLSASCAGVSGELQRLDASVAQLPAAFDALHAGLEDLEKLK